MPNELLHRRRPVGSMSAPSAATTFCQNRNEENNCDIEQGMTTNQSSTDIDSGRIEILDDHGDDDRDLDVLKKTKNKKSSSSSLSSNLLSSLSHLRVNSFLKTTKQNLFSHSNNHDYDDKQVDRNNSLLVDNATTTTTMCGACTTDSNTGNSNNTINTFTSSTSSVSVPVEIQPSGRSMAATAVAAKAKRTDGDGGDQEEPLQSSFSPSGHSNRPPTAAATATNTSTTRISSSHPPEPSSRRPSLSQITYRQVLPRDRQQIQELHEEWFPVEYQEDFYDDLCENRQMFGSKQPLITLLATVPKTTATVGGGKGSSASSTRRKIEIISDDETDCQQEENDDIINQSLEDGDDDNEDEIVGCIIGCFISADQLNRASRRLLVPEFYGAAESNMKYHPHSNNSKGHNHHDDRRYRQQQRPRRHSKLFYIMTLGVVKEYRHLGLATKLVKKLFHETIQPMGDECGCMYLHVITFNDAAIQFYEQKLGFWRVQEIEGYYRIDDEQYNCYLYAKYFNSNWGHLDLYMIVSRWASSLWTSVSHVWTKRRPEKNMIL